MSRTDRLAPASPPGDPTTSYDGGAFRPAPATAPAAGAAAETSDELRAMLRRRLGTLSLISLCAIGALAVILTPFYVQDSDWHYLVVVWFLVAGAGGYTALLRGRRPLSLRSLRVLELVFFGAVVLYMTEEMVFTVFAHRFAAIFAKLGRDTTDFHLRPLWYEHGPQTVQGGFMSYWMMWALSGWQMLGWVLLLFGYGLFIPNTWKRATLIIGAAACVPVLFLSAVSLTDPEISWKQAGVTMLATGVGMTFAAALTIFGAHRIESLRREAVAARRLGQYQLKELLGSGGMGDVYRAEHVLLRRPCAIKLIRPERAGDPQNLRRFEREVRATATLTNWHTVEIYDYGHAADGTFYYVMELLPGLTLDELVRRHGPLPPGRTVHLLRQVCAALREAHAIGLIHRDIKPGNVIVGERGGLSDVAKLLDFGLVRTAGIDARAEKLTQTGSLVGTPAYMSPEQAAGGDDVDARGDIYSLGAVAYFLLTGRPPFVGKTALHVVAAHLREEPRPLTDHRHDCPSDLQAAVLRCLQKEPERRFPDTDGLEGALARCGCAADWDAARAAAWWRDHGGHKDTASP